MTNTAKNAAWWQLGAVVGVTGAALGLVGNLWHPRLPADSEEALRIVAEHSRWDLMHAVILAAGVCLAVFFVSLATTFESQRGRAWAWTAVTIGLLGGSVMLVGVAIDGFVGKYMANALHESSGEAREIHFRVGQAIELLHSGLLYVWLTLFFGVPFAAFGMAGLGERAFPRPLAWSALVLGSVLATLAAAAYIAPSVVPLSGLAVLALALTVWVLVVAGWLWRSARPGL